MTSSPGSRPLPVGPRPCGDASAALSDFSDDVIIGSMSSIDDGEVTLDDGRTFTADAVIVTAGAVPTRRRRSLDSSIALPLRTADDALTLRAEIEAASSVVIVGGGATGVQLAGAVAAQPSRRRRDAHRGDGGAPRRDG